MMSVPPLRILQVNSRLQGGGTDDQCVQLAGGLVRLGHQVWIAGPPGREFAPAIQRLEIPLAPIKREGPLKLALIVQVARYLRAQRIQIVHAHHGRDYWPTVLAARISGVRPKIVCTRHLAKSPSSAFSRRFLLRACDALVAVSQFVAQVLREGAYEPESSEPERRARPPMRGQLRRIHVIYGGINTDLFRPFDAGELRRQWNLSPEQRAFVVVGGYDLPRGKGQREFLTAAARIHPKSPDARFLILGRGSMASRLQEDVADLGLTGKAWLLPYCHDMPRAMNALDCLVHPQVGTEALGLVIGEAQACGRPVIASQLDGIPEALAAAKQGRLVSPGSIDDLAQAMQAQADQPAPTTEERLQMHAAVAARFSLSRFARDYANLFQELVDPAGK